MRDAAPTTKQSSNKSGKRKRHKKKRTNSRQVVCQVCRQSFKEITAEHLRQHGLTLTRYRRMYHCSTRAPGTSQRQDRSAAGSSGPSTLPDRNTVATIAQRIVEDPDVIREMAGEVAEAIFGSSLRDALRISLVSALSERLKAHGESLAALNAVRAELAQPWRMQQGGPNGTPTPTKDLLGMASVLGQEVKTGEELLLKTVKLAIEEWRSHKGAGAVEGGLPDRFTGDGERLPIPATLSPQDRETMRTLWGMFDKAIDTRRVLTIDTTATPSPTEEPSSPSPLEAVMQATCQPGEAAPEPEGLDDSGCTPLVGDDEPF